jgi:hypothetical protein
VVPNQLGRLLILPAGCFEVYCGELVDEIGWVWEEENNMIDKRTAWGMGVWQMSC